MSICSCGELGHADWCAKVQCPECGEREPGPRPCGMCWNSDKLMNHVSELEELIRSMFDAGFPADTEMAALLHERASALGVVESAYDSAAEIHRS